MHRLYMSAFLLLLAFTGYAQEAEHREEKEGHHQLTLAIGHANVRKGIDNEGDRKWLVLPAWILNYTYHINHKWCLGLHNDIIIQEFKVESGHDDEVLTRSTPVTSVVIGGYKPGKHFTFLLGAGCEFAHDNYFMNRIGTEYAYPLTNGWELSGGLSYDIKWSAYDNWNISFGIGKIF